MSKKNNLKDSYIYRGAGGSAINDSKGLIKLREDIFQLKEKLEEEKTKTEVLQLIAENEKEKKENIKAKFQTAKKLNNSLITKLKERDISISKNIKNENNLLKKQITEKDKKISELKLEIKKLNGEIDTYKKEIQKNNMKEKDYFKENSLLKVNLSEKENIIKLSNNKLNEINVKYTEEKNKNQKLLIELKELNLKNQRLIDERKKIPKGEKDTFNKINTTIYPKNKKINNNSFEEDKSNKKGSTNIETRSSKALKITKTRSEIIHSKMEEKENNSLYKYKNQSSNIIKETNEDNISISASSEEIDDNENDLLNEFKKNSKLLNTTNNNSINNNNKEKEKSKEIENSSSLSEDNPELDKEVEKIMNMNINMIQNDYEKYHEKTNSSFKDDKSTKMEIDKNITNMQSYSET